MPASIKWTVVVPRLREWYARRRRPPTYTELQQLFGYRSKGGVSWLVAKLVERGLLAKDDAGRLLPTAALEGGLRLLGTVKAGFPSPAEEELLDVVSLEQWLIQRREATYLVQVRGDSMRDAGILPGDFVLAERGRTPKPGDIVIAQVDGEWTMKRYARRGGRIILEAANPAYPAIERYRSLSVEAVVIANVRRYR